MLSPFILHFLPILFFLFFCTYFGKSRVIHPISMFVVLFFVATTALAISFYPEELNYDKPRYTNSYFTALHNVFINTEYKDIGWPYYIFFCSRLFGSNVDLFYLFTATIYIGGYFIFAWHFFPKKLIGYFIVFSAGCLGFTAYGVNTIRAGVALSLLLIYITLYDSKVLKLRVFSLLFALLAILIHKSMIIPLTGYVISIYIKNMKWILTTWFFCFFLSAVNFDLSELFEYIGFVDERVESYIEGADEFSSYKSGFRIDFIIYSLIPMLFSWYYIKKKHIVNDFFLHIVRTYLLSNAVWLLAIRIHYSDRLAYLSWFLIPIILLQPVCNSQINFKSPQNMVLFAMLVFLSLPLLLFVRS